jgi:hypothetical protein
VRFKVVRTKAETRAKFRAVFENAGLTFVGDDLVLPMKEND